MGLVKIIVSALLIAAVSEVAKRSTSFAALTLSLPLISILSFIWVYYENRDAQQVAALSRSTFWLIPPSLILFLVLPLMIRHGFSFPVALSAGIGSTVLGYLVYVAILGRFGITF